MGFKIWDKVKIIERWNTFCWWTIASFTSRGIPIKYYLKYNGIFSSKKYAMDSKEQTPGKIVYITGTIYIVYLPSEDINIVISANWLNTLKDIPREGKYTTDLFWKTLVLPRQ